MKVCKISLISLIAVFSINMPVDARVNVKSTGRGNIDAYNQVAAMRNQQAQTQALATTASDTGDLPVAVEDKELAESILNNSAENVTLSDLEACSMIYPSGVFKWGIPESGIRLNKTTQCVAVVELRDANSKAVLATTTLAAGDMMKCNIDEFPQSGWLPALGKVELPADAAPTMEQVEAVMNEEQKQNAGIKIAATAILGGLAGNLLAPKEAGDNKLFGTGKTQLADTAIGIAAGAGIGAASTYSGKVAGDTIKSTAVNAASGMIVGNMLAGASGGDSALATTKCTVNDTEHDCVIGTISKKSNNTFDKEFAGKELYINANSGNIIQCGKNANDKKECSALSTEKLVSIKLDMGNDSNLKDVYYGDTMSEEARKDVKRFVRDDTNPQIFVENSESDADVYFHVIDAIVTDGKATHVYAVCDSDLSSTEKRYKKSEFYELESKCYKFYYRNSNGSVGSLIYNGKDTKELSAYSFEASTRDASDGGLVDLSNESRVKGTLTGTATGGALGGFAGYQGAKNEITERWLAEQRNYEGSLSNFVCMTGGRFLSQYNSYAEIPNYTKPEE